MYAAMGGKWSAKNLKDETKFKAKWKHQPTVAIRIPLEFRDEVLRFVSKLDNLNSRESVKEAINFDSKKDSDYRVELIDKKVIVYTPYDPSREFQSKCKSIEGYKFESSDRSWRFPVRKVELVISKLTDDRFYISPEVKDAVANLQRQREEEKALKKAIAFSQSQEIIRLVQAANLDAPLSNGWYLREYQKTGVEWLLAHRKGGIHAGGILADDMGLGKSLTALCAAKAMQSLYNCVLIVVSPVSLIEGWGRFAEIAEVTVEMFSNNYQKIPTPLENQEYILICDEAHCFQDIESKRTKQILALAHHKNCLATWMLTGTPIKNGRPINLMPLLMAVQHPLVADKWLYQKRYCKANRKSVSETRTAWDVTGASHLKELAQKTQDVILRRKKSEVLAQLPPKTRLFREVDLEPEVEKEYRSNIKNLVEDYRQRVKRGEVDENAEALVKLNILRRLGSGAKVPFAVAQAQEILEQEQSVVIFTEFLDSAKAIHSQLMDLGMGRCELLTGETKVEERQAIVDRFQTGESKVFIGTIKAGGVGLTLTASSHVLLMDRPWTPGDAEQAEDRCYRDSQQNAVFAIWLQLGEVDKAIDNLLLQKSRRIDLVLQGKRQTLRGIDSPHDLAKELLAIL